MKIQSINNYYIPHKQTAPKTHTITHTTQLTPAFQGKYTYTKAIGGLFGTAGALGAVIGTAILGGISLPIIAVYTAISAASGAIIGHEFDKNNKNDEDNNTKQTINKTP